VKKGQVARPAVVGVVGGGSADEPLLSLAEDLGRQIAKKGFVLMTGGGAGVMEAVSRGASEAGGLVIGILPSDRNHPIKGYPNEYVNIPIYTGLSDARNVIISKSPDVIVALGGGYGTISEIAIALKGLIPVIAISCSENNIFRDDEHFIVVGSVRDVMDQILRVIENPKKLHK